MLGLKLRNEFLGEHMQGTAISLHSSNAQGAIDKSPEEFLTITYPTADVLIALRAIRQEKNGKPVVLMGGRGKGKSHILALLHHAVNTPDKIEAWLARWGETIHDNSLSEIKLARGFFPISEAIHNHEYRYLWDLLFDRHPNGSFYRGKFESSGRTFPPRSLLEEMFTERPICLILDELQTWYDGLPEKDRNGNQVRANAFNFIQILSEIAVDRPDIFMFLVSVLTNETDAFRQIHRQTPLVIDFSGPTAKRDRQKLLLHRLFENRAQIQTSEITNLCRSYAQERFRLLFSQNGTADVDRIENEVYACWPYAPELIDLLEDQILMAQAAQETRDMIRILALVFRERGDYTRIISSADFYIDGGNNSVVQTLVDSIASQDGQEHLREVAQRNLEEVRSSGANVEWAREIITSIWMHSMSPGRSKGAKATEIQLALTANNVVDDNNFRVQLGNLVENSMNIHDDSNSQLFWFEREENPRAKVKVNARNDRLWQTGTTGIDAAHPGKDVFWLKRTLKRILVSEAGQSPSDVIVLGENWNTAPWPELDDDEQPERWNKVVLLVVPEEFKPGANINALLGNWLVKHITKRRNTVRFLLQSPDKKNLFLDKDIIYLARCSYLCSSLAWGTDPNYRNLRADFDRPLENELKSRFSRFALLRDWNYQRPEQCGFDVERLSETGNQIPCEVENSIAENIFDLRDFEARILAVAQNNEMIGDVFDDLVEPVPHGSGNNIPYLGEQKILTHIQRITAQGKIAMNVDGTWVVKESGQTQEDAQRIIASRTSRVGNELRRIRLSLPDAANLANVVTQPRPMPETSIPPQAGTANANNGNPPAIDLAGEGMGNNFPEAPVVHPPVAKRTGPAKGIDLGGQLEAWGIAGDKNITSIKLQFTDIPAQQLKQMLQRLPVQFKAVMDITYNEGE